MNEVKQFKERLMVFIKSQNLNPARFEQMASLSNGYVKRFKSIPTTRILERIFSAFPELNRGWLLDGKGEMLHPAAVKVQSVGRDNNGNMLIGNDLEPYWKKLATEKTDEASRLKEQVSILEIQVSGLMNTLQEQTKQITMLIEKLS